MRSIAALPRREQQRIRAAIDPSRRGTETPRVHQARRRRLGCTACGSAATASSMKSLTPDSSFMSSALVIGGTCTGKGRRSDSRSPRPVPEGLAPQILIELGADEESAPTAVIEGLTGLGDRHCRPTTNRHLSICSASGPFAEIVSTDVPLRATSGHGRPMTDLNPLCFRTLLSGRQSTSSAQSISFIEAAAEAGVVRRESSAGSCRSRPRSSGCCRYRPATTARPPVGRPG